MKEEDGWRQIRPGVWANKELAPKTGTVLTSERIAENLRSLNTPWTEKEEDDGEGQGQGRE